MLTITFAILTTLLSFVYLGPILRNHIKPTEIGKTGYIGAIFGLSVGTLSLYMLFLGLLPGKWLMPQTVLPMPWIIIGGTILGSTYKLQISNNQDKFTNLISIICFGGFTVILINCLSYPFYRYDVLARFAPNARLLFETGTIPNSLTGYPLGIQMLYSFAFMAANSVNDHVAGLIIAGFSGAMLLTTFAVSKQLFSKRAAFSAVVLLLSSQIFVDWSTSGYVDIPVGVYHGLTFMFAYNWMLNGKQSDAIYSGIMIGLALWTKQSAFVLIPAICVVPLIRIKEYKHFHKEMKNVLISISVSLLIALPWYLRSYLLIGPDEVIPAPGAYDAQYIDNSIKQLLTFLTSPQEWGIALGSTIMIGITLCVIYCIQPNLDNVSTKTINPLYRSLLIGAFILPYHIIWWQNFSYDTRYLLSSAVIYASVAGHAIDWLLKQLSPVFKPQNLFTILIMGTLVLFGSFNRIGAVYNLIVHPLQNDDDKLSRISTETWSLVQYIKTNIESNAKLYAMDGSLAYWLHDYQFKQGYPFHFDDIKDYDYLITSETGNLVYKFYDSTDNEVIKNLNNSNMFSTIHQHSADIIIYKIHNVEQQ